MLTEQDASDRWCPFARVAMGWTETMRADTYGRPIEEAAVSAAVNRTGTGSGSAHTNCIASGCMAWRWNQEWSSATEEGAGGDMVLRLKRKSGEPRIGHCGLAGAP